MTRSIGSLGQNRVFVIHISSWWIHRKRELGAGSQQHLQRRWRVEDIIFYAVLFWNQKRLPCTQHKPGDVCCCFFFPPFLFFLFCWSFRGGIKTWSKTSRNSDLYRRFTSPTRCVISVWSSTNPRWSRRHWLLWEIGSSIPFFWCQVGVFLGGGLNAFFFFYFCPCLGKWSKFDSTWYFSDGLKPPIQLLLPENERELVSQTYTS